MTLTTAAGFSLSAPFDHCLPAGCFAEFDLRSDSLKKLKAADGTGKITFKDGGGREIALPLSFKGFRPALDALLQG